MSKADNLLQVLQGNSPEKIRKALSFTQESVLKELADNLGVVYTNKQDVIKQLSRII